MKEWKVEIVNALNEKAKHERVIWFYEFAKNELGYKHIKTQDMRDIVIAFLKQNTNYRAIHEMKTPYTSLFCGLILADKEITFDNE